MHMDKPSHYTATITSKKQIAPHVYELTFSLTSGEVRYAAGQYVSFIIDEKTRRQYSFCCPSTDSTKFDIVVDVAPMGPGSKFFLEKKVGDTVQVLAPLGTFRFDDHKSPVVFVATGTGIVPFRTMIEEYLVSGGKQKITLFWGLRYEEDIFWKDLLDHWQQFYPNFHYEIVLSKPSTSWQGKIGHVTEHIREVPNFETCPFYLCGNRHMISDVKTDLLAHNVPEGRIKTELF